jgi:signal peptidase I
MDREIERKLTLAAGQEALARGYELTLTTAGASMLPLISHCDRVTVIRSDADDLRCGDIILYHALQDETHLVAHRLIHIKKENGLRHFVTKGDTQFRCDQAIPSRAVIGKIIKIQKGRFPLFPGRGLGKIINVFFYLLSASGVMPLLFAISFKIRQVFVQTK